MSVGPQTSIEDSFLVGSCAGAAIALDVWFMATDRKDKKTIEKEWKVLFRTITIITYYD